jgi:glycosyltransferase involved in cell wall biosynthesis
MRIALLCQANRYAGGRSVGVNFLKQLKEVAPQHTYLAVVPQRAGYEDIELPANSERYVVTVGESSFERWRFEQFILPKIVRDFKPDIVFGMANLALKNPPCKQAILFHRSQLVYPFKHLANFGWKGLLVEGVFKNRLRECLPKTQIVFCQTPVARERFSRTFNYPIGNIAIAPNAVSKFSQIPREQAGVPAILRDNDNWFTMFFLSAYYPHKNPEILVKLFRKYPKELSNVRCVITIDPNQNSKASRLLKKIQKYKLQERIINVGHLPHQELASYYYNSNALFLPTALESFSGTYPEAMYFGCPIITSDLDFARYVCGDAAVYFDLWNIDDIVKKICLIRDDRTLQQKLIKNGRERLGEFFCEWPVIVEKVIKQLEEVVTN